MDEFVEVIDFVQCWNFFLSMADPFNGERRFCTRNGAFVEISLENCERSLDRIAYEIIFFAQMPVDILFMDLYQCVPR